MIGSSESGILMPVEEDEGGQRPRSTSRRKSNTLHVQKEGCYRDRIIEAGSGRERADWMLACYHYLT
jgi:hypothetical protein